MVGLGGLLALILWLLLPKFLSSHTIPTDIDDIQPGIDPLDGLDEHERWHIENFWPPPDVSIAEADQAMMDGDDGVWLGV